jgi:acetolactate synthase-1/2/3 large subunit
MLLKKRKNDLKRIKKKITQTGAYLLLNSLVQQGVNHLFGYPGGAILPIYDELYNWEKENLIRHILVRHEQSAAHAADAYARTTKKVGVCFATSGPGATNLVTGIANARMDSIPLIIITGQVGRAFIGTDAFQETDIFGITLPIVKHSYTVRKTELLPQILLEAFFLAENNRPGPVLIDIPKDVGLEETFLIDFPNLNTFFEKASYRSAYLMKISHFYRLFEAIQGSYQPLCYIGGGTVRGNAFQLIHQFAKLFQIPVTTTLMGKSAYNEKDHLSLGMLGMHGSAYANFAVSECDLLFALGARFDDRVTGKLDEFASDAEVIHIEIDSAEIAKNRCPQIAMLGDVKQVFLHFFRLLRQDLFKNRNEKILNLQTSSTIVDFFQTETWRKRIEKWKSMYPLFVDAFAISSSAQPLSFSSELSSLSPQEAIRWIGLKYPNGIFTTDVGQHQMWSAQLINCQPKKWVSSSGLGTMGFGLPAAIGAKIANPFQDVICISGDSSFQMCFQELGTISQYQLGILVIIINNGWQGMVRQWQESFYGNRFSNSYMKNGMPQFAELAKGYQIRGYTIKSAAAFQNFIAFSSLISDNPKYLKKNSTIPILLDVTVLEKENCYPMVTPGRSTGQMMGLNEEHVLGQIKQEAMFQISRK